MSERLSRRMVLLSAYEDFTRRETVSLRDENFELLRALQVKKAKVVVELQALDDQPDPVEAADFDKRITRLLEQEKRNSDVLKEKMASNRGEFRKLTQSSLSANKLKHTYAAPIDRSVKPGSLKGKA